MQAASIPSIAVFPEAVKVPRNIAVVFHVWGSATVVVLEDVSAPPFRVTNN